jgi:hypothetical protein
MRLSSLLALATLSASVLHAQSGAYRAAPSTRATATVSLTLSDTAAQRAAGKPALISIDYGQPHLRGRKIHTADLVPLGTVWRLGANDATILTTDVDLTIGGQAVPKGRYVMQALPEASGWTLILQRETTGGPVMVMAHDPAKDFARIALTRSALASSVESLTMALVPSTAAGAQRGELSIAWDTVLLKTEWSVR